jgi:hypothetical protein
MRQQHRKKRQQTGCFKLGMRHTRVQRTGVPKDGCTEERSNMRKTETMSKHYPSSDKTNKGQRNDDDLISRVPIYGNRAE